jgi:hypothetical protein
MMQKIIMTTKPVTDKTIFFTLEEEEKHDNEPPAIDQTKIGETINWTVRQLMAFRARGKPFRIHKKT